jgi:tol-pal system protein YbgF
MRHRLIFAIYLLCLLPSFTAFAEAPVVDDSENFAFLEEQQQAAQEQPVAREQDDAFDDDMQPLAKDNTTNTKDTSNAALLDKLQGMQQDIQELRGQLEVQAHDLKLLQEQQLSFYKDLDARIRNTPATSAKNESATDLSMGAKEPQAIIQKTTPSIRPITTTTIAANPADEQISYLAAYELIKNKHFDEALEAMQAFVTKYPRGGYAANGQYWLGELYMVKKDYAQAMEHFEIVRQQFPSSSKCSASMLKIGYAMAASGNIDGAKERLRDVVKKYPDTNTAQLATAKLQKLGG